MEEWRTSIVNNGVESNKMKMLLNVEQCAPLLPSHETEKAHGNNNLEIDCWKKSMLPERKIMMTPSLSFRVRFAFYSLNVHCAHVCVLSEQTSERRFE